MAPGRPGLRWAAKLRAPAASVIAGSLAGMGLYFGNLAYVTASGEAKPPLGCSPAACVTDGRDIFDPGIPQVAAIERAIAQEDAQVRSTGRPYVSVALLNPYTVTPASGLSLTRIIDELRGAYLAQAQVNATGILGVQLLLANEGDSTEPGAITVVRELEAMEGAPSHLVAVAGMGISNSQTEAAAKALSANGIMVVSALTTADRLNGHNYPGLDAISPNAAEQVGLLASVLSIPGNAALVRDTQATDIYTGDLVTDFTQAIGPRTYLHLYPYTPHAPFTDNQFAVIASNVCSQQGAQPPLVLYAGRVSVLPELITQFQTSSACKGKKIIIASADDADGLDPAATRSPQAASGAQVSVEYTDVINLGKLTPTFKAFYRNDLAAVDPTSAGLSDVVTIGTYNAMMTAWTAISTAYDSSRQRLPTSQDVQGLWDLLNGRYAPTGAAGPINLSPYGALLNQDFPVFLDSGGKRITIKA